MGSFQFNLDDKETKRVARGMLRMVNAINGEHLAAATAARDTPQPRVEVKCATCHRGATKPLFIQDIMADVIAEEGVEAAIARYRELREAKFGGYSYDFRAGPLTSLGEALGGEGQVDDAVAVLDLALEYYPDQSSIYWTYGNLLARAGRTEDAIEKLRRGSELAEGGFKRFFDNAVARLRGSG
jgi:tetratricopeptide (TPR) repeat protein